MQGLEAAFALGNTERGPGLDGLGKALDRVPAHIAQPETIAEQSPRRRGDDNPAGVGEALQPRGEIGGVADDRLLLRRTLADEVADDHEAGGDADPRRELFARGSVQSRDHLDEFEPGVHRARRVVLMGAGKAEIGEDAVAHELGDEAVVARDHSRAGVLIGADHPAHVLGIEPRRHCCRPDKIAEHHGKLTPLGFVAWLRLDLSGWVIWRARATQTGDRLE